MIKKFIEQGRIIKYVLLENNEKIGYMRVNFSFEPDYIYIENIIIETRFRNKGFGKKLVNHIKKQKKPILLTAANKKVTKFWEKMGFQISGDWDDYSWEPKKEFHE